LFGLCLLVDVLGVFAVEKDVVVADDVVDGGLCFGYLSRVQALPWIYDWQFTGTVRAVGINRFGGQSRD